MNTQAKAAVIMRVYNIWMEETHDNLIKLLCLEILSKDNEFLVIQQGIEELETIQL